MSANKLILTGGSGEAARQVEVEQEFRGQLPEEGGTHLLVRCWNKTTAQIETLLQESRAFIHPHIPLSSILIVIDRDKDHESMTMKAVREHTSSDGLPVIPIHVSGPAEVPNWTRMLNGPLGFLNVEGVRDGRLLCMSFDTVPDDLRRLPALSDAPIPALFVRRTPAAFVPQETADFLAQDVDGIRRDVSAMVHDTVPYFLEQKDEYPSTALNISPVICRNTFTLWGRLSQLLHSGGFDPQANTEGGQEDTEMFFRLFITDQHAMPAHVPVWFHSDNRSLSATTLTAVGVQTHQQKIARERGAIRGMLKWLRSTKGRIPKEKQDFPL